MTEEKKRIPRRIMLLMIILASGGEFLYNLPILCAIFAIIYIWFICKENISFICSALSKAYLFVLLFLVISAYHVVMNHHVTYSFLIRLFNFLLAICMLQCYLKKNKLEQDAFQDDYVFLGKVFVIHALVSTVLIIAVPQLFTPIATHENIYTIGHVFFSCIASEVNSFTSIIPRCMGLFWEPGVLQFFINIYLFILLFCSNEQFDRKWVFLSLFVILLTQSITGWVLAAGQIIYYAVKKRNRFVLFTLILVVPPIIPMALSVFTQKFFGETGADAGSYWMRLGDALSSFQIALKNPLLGIGFDHTDFILYRREISYQGILDAEAFWDRTNTNSVFTLFYGIGFPLAIYLLFQLYHQKLLRKEPFLFFSIMIVSCMSEPLLLLSFPLMFLFSGMIDSREEKETNSNPGILPTENYNAS